MNNQTSNEMVESISARPSLRLWALYCLVFLGVLATKFSFFEIIPYAEIVWRAGVIIGALGLGYLYLLRITTLYTINSIELVEYDGVFSRRVTRVPLNRITNYDFRASFLERILGIGDVLIDTPGGTGYELSLTNLNRADADKITNGLRDLIAQQKIADAGDNAALRDSRRRAAAAVAESKLS
jgi:uncharacterized membrane protein YdbT with pleckstrin-like domain